MGAAVMTLAVIAVLFFFSPLISLKNKEHRCTSYTSGKIIRIESYTRIKVNRLRQIRYYVSTVAYEVDGRTYECKNRRTSDPEEYHIGDDCWVMYNPHNHEECYQYDELISVRNTVLAGIGVWIGISAIALTFYFMQ